MPPTVQDVIYQYLHDFIRRFYPEPADKCQETLENLAGVPLMAELMRRELTRINLASRAADSAQIDKSVATMAVLLQGAATERKVVRTLERIRSQCSLLGTHAHKNALADIYRAVEEIVRQHPGYTPDLLGPYSYYGDTIARIAPLESDIRPTRRF